MDHKEIFSIKNSMSLEGRKALITGATGHLGKQISLALAELGAELILTDLPGDNYQNLLKVFKNINFSNFEIIECDLEDEESRQSLIDSINQPISILINNAAFAGSAKLEGWNTSFEEQSLESWRRAMEVNLTAVFHLTRDLSPLMKKSLNGSIINIASIYGIRAPDYSLYKNTDIGNPSAYSSSKGGLIQFTRWLASTLAPDIRVNSISPGGLYRNQPKEFIQRYENKTPLLRMGTENDIVGMVAFLSSDISSYITGQNIVIDGGWSI